MDVLRPARFSGAADSIVLLDSSGRTLPVQGFTRLHERAHLTRGRTSVLGVSGEACTVVWYRDGHEVGRDLLSLTDAELNEIER